MGRNYIGEQNYSSKQQVSYSYLSSHQLCMLISVQIVCKLITSECPQSSHYINVLKWSCWSSHRFQSFSSIDLDILHLYEYVCTFNDLFSHTCKNINTHTHTHTQIYRIPKYTYNELPKLVDVQSSPQSSRAGARFLLGNRLRYHCLAHPRFSWGVALPNHTNVKIDNLPVGIYSFFTQ